MYFDREIVMGIMFLRSLCTDRRTASHSWAKEQGMSPIYMNEIAAKLRAKGLFHSHEVRKSGATRHRRWRELTLYDVVVALKGEIEIYDKADSFVKQKQAAMLDFCKAIKIYDDNEVENVIKGWKI